MSSESEDPVTDQLVQAAAEWRARQDAGLTETEQAELVRWLEADVRHAELFEEMESTWAILDRTSELPPERLRVPAKRTDPVIPRRGFSPIYLWGTGIAAAAAVAIGWVVWSNGRPPETSPTSFQQAAEVAVGDIKRMDLPDGSVIRLNSGAAVTVHYSEAERSVHLVRGEAHFEVAKNRARPFVVQAKGASVRAVGTAFNVSLQANSVEVMVTEGKVTVAPPPETAAGDSPAESREPPSTLIAGQKLVMALQSEKAPVVASVAPAEMAQSLAWQDRRLEFDSAPLDEILAQFNRFNVHQLVLAPDSSALAKQRFGGSFRADDPATFIELIRMRANVVVEPGPEQTVLRLAR